MFAVKVKTILVLDQFAGMIEKQNNSELDGKEDL
jgi:hypothetical protein